MIFLKKFESRLITLRINYILYELSKVNILIYYTLTYNFYLIISKCFKNSNSTSLFYLKHLYKKFKILIKNYFYEFILDGLYFRVKLYKKYNCLGFILGYNHYILYYIPNEIKLNCSILRRKFLLCSYNKAIIGYIMHEIINLKYPNLFKGRGIKVVNYIYRRKLIIKKKLK